PMSSIASTQETDCSDVLCVGFGPAGLSIATAMADEGLISTADLNTTSSADRMKVEFLEKQASFCWHGGMLLDGSKMQISFLKDLVTLRNPSSRFSFVKYLHENDRLVPFMNLGSWTPYREEFNDYLSWVAAKFDNSCTYGERVLSIEPVVCDKSGVVSRVRVESENTSTGLRSVRETKSLVMAVGGQPKYPEFARMYFAAASNNTSSRDCPAVAHSSQYIHRVQSMLPDRDAPYTIAVIGQGQSGAELFMDLSDRYPNATIKLIFRDTALRPSDASPFVNEVFNPEYRDEFYQMSAQDRQTHRTRNGATNYSVVNSNLIDSIYGMLYQQGLPTHAGKRKCTLLPGRNVVAMEQAPNGGVILHLIRGRGAASIYESLTLNAVFLATGYERSAHETMLAPLMAYLRRDPATSHLLVGRDYKAQVIDPSRFQPAIYLQGCCEHTHGLSDTLLSVLGVRGGEVVESIK
ncbi:L-lysine 6-monooxygenase, partial [Fimicolochytrium jonesii]|uniref:L-lysine 6-monooxygenase n=1 Tax=Fimicolochytrium jonesii TaxID=1396493 RepID=UPI0022FDD1E9